MANDFNKFIVYGQRGSKESLSNKPWNNYLKIGDIVQMDEADGSLPNCVWDHTVIVTRTDKSNIYLTYHTTNTPDMPLSKLMVKYPNTNMSLSIC